MREDQTHFGTLIQDGWSIAMVTDAEGTPQPSRWESSRCIDFVITSKGEAVDNMRYLTERVSDHKILTFSFKAASTVEAATTEVPTPNLGKPVGMQQNAWETAVKEAFEKLNFKQSETTLKEKGVEQSWMDLNAAVQLAFVEAKLAFKAHNGGTLGRGPRAPPFRLPRDMT